MLESAEEKTNRKIKLHVTYDYLDDSPLGSIAPSDALELFHRKRNNQFRGSVAWSCHGDTVRCIVSHDN